MKSSSFCYVKASAIVNAKSTSKKGKDVSKGSNDPKTLDNKIEPLQLILRNVEDIKKNAESTFLSLKQAQDKIKDNKTFKSPLKKIVTRKDNRRNPSPDERPIDLKYYSKLPRRAKSLLIRIPDENITLKYIPKEPSIQKESERTKEPKEPEKKKNEEGGKLEKSAEDLRIIKEENNEEEVDELKIINNKKSQKRKGGAKNNPNSTEGTSKSTPSKMIKNVNQTIIKNNNKTEISNDIEKKNHNEQKNRNKLETSNNLPSPLSSSISTKRLGSQEREIQGEQVKMEINENYSRKVPASLVERQSQNEKIQPEARKISSPKKEPFATPKEFRKNLLLESILSPRMYQKGFKSLNKQSVENVPPSRINMSYNVKLENIVTKNSPKALNNPPLDKDFSASSTLVQDPVYIKIEQNFRVDSTKNESLLSSASTNASDIKRKGNYSKIGRPTSHDYSKSSKLKERKDEENETIKFLYDEAFIVLDEIANLIAVEGFKFLKVNEENLSVLQKEALHGFKNFIKNVTDENRSMKEIEQLYTSPLEFLTGYDKFKREFPKRDRKKTEIEINKLQGHLKIILDKKIDKYFCLLKKFLDILLPTCSKLVQVDSGNKNSAAHSPGKAKKQFDFSMSEPRYKAKKPQADLSLSFELPNSYKNEHMTKSSSNLAAKWPDSKKRADGANIINSRSPRK